MSQKFHQVVEDQARVVTYCEWLAQCIPANCEIVVLLDCRLHCECRICFVGTRNLRE